MAETENTTASAVSRRQALGWMALSGAALAATGLGADDLHAAPYVPASERIKTPAQALAELAAGNRRFVDGRATNPNRSMARIREVAPSQAPFAAFLSCADSRVPVELLFDQGFGDLFVCRTAGNIVSPDNLASLEFGTAVLGAKALVVLGHSECGAVKAAMPGAAVPGQISSLYQFIRPGINDAPAGDVPAATRANVMHQVEVLTNSSPVIGTLIKEGKLAVRGAVYDLGTGRVTMFNA